jgi:YbbR domain-containing protein
VSLRGPESQVRGVEPRLLELHVDLRDAPPGVRTVSLAGENLRGLRPDIEVVQIEPNRLQVEIDRRLRKTLPVSPLLVGVPPAGHSFYGAEVQPDLLEVEGPESVLESLERLRTDPIHLEGRTAPFVVPVGAVPESPSARVLDPRPLEVRVEVDASPVRRSFDGVPVVLAGQTSGATAQPSSIRILVTGPPSLLGRIAPDQVRAVADLTGLAPGGGTHEVPLRVEFLDVPPSELARLAVRSMSHSKVAVRLSSRRAPA